MNGEIKERLEKIEQGVVPKGYKKTKIGILPEDWEVKKLGKIGELLRGKGIPKSQIKDSGVDCVIYGQIYTIYNFFTKELYSQVDSETAENSTEIQYGDLLFTSSGETSEEIGKCVMYLGHKRAVVGGDIVILRPKDIIKNKVYSYLLNTEIINKQKYKLAQGHSVVHLYSSHLKDIKIPIIPLQEQEKIAQILSTWDKAIEKIEQLIQKKEIQKKGLTWQLLTGETRLPGFDGEWEKKKLGEVAKVVSGGTPSTNVSNYWDGNIKWATPTDITASGKFIVETNKKITEEGLKHSSATLLPPNSILMTSRATIGERAINIEPMATNQGFKSFVCKENLQYMYLYYLVEVLKNEFLSKSSGSTFSEISKKNTENINFFLPPLPEQKAIADILSTADREIQLLNQLLTSKKQQKQGLMQLLLTGIVRV